MRVDPIYEGILLSFKRSHTARASVVLHSLINLNDYGGIGLNCVGLDDFNRLKGSLSSIGCDLLDLCEGFDDLNHFWKVFKSNLIKLTRF